ncbi:TonB-dependent receptor (plasmid) [Spirosoma sp. SC4-14]|uniref:SusC/RagA family TonB-linked outer membrane protein n=1 Tax=Spirosoma sp. SC4-14 TaxID=3128900 RepID=UPI0030D47736
MNHFYFLNRPPGLWRLFKLLLLLGTFTASAQPGSFRINGTVTDSKGEPLPGANIAVLKTTVGTSSNAEGKYSLNVATDKAVLVFSSIGYLKQEVTVGNRRTIDISLVEDLNNLDEVVVVGYGQVKRKDLTGSVGKANMEDVKKAPVPSFDQALAGRIAGVQVTSNDGQPGAAAQITIRGSSVTQDASPLYVIDGFPMENIDVNSINPADIESMEVLKDASSIAVYGARGANGVILITTRRGKAGPVRITYGYQTSIQRAIKTMKMMSPYEFVKLQLELDSLASTPSVPSTRFRNIYLSADKTLDSYKNESGSNWQQLLLQDGITQNHSLNLSGGSTDTRFSLSGSLYDQKGIILNTGLKRYEGRLALDQRISKQLKMGFSASYSNSTTFGTIPSSGNGGGVVQGMWQYRPVAGVGNQNLVSALIDSVALQDFYSGNGAASLGDNLINPLIQAQNEYRKSITNTAMLNAFVEYSFLDNFKLRLSGGYTSTSPKSEAFYNSQTQQGNIFKNSAGAIPNASGINGFIGNTINSSYLNENILSYNRIVNKVHSFDALAGFTYQFAKSSTNAFKSINIPQAQEYLGLLSMVTGTANTPLVGGSQWQLYSFLSRINYAYKDKYLITLSARSDGSSKFTPGKQWGYFPSAAVAWRFVEEPFMKKLLPKLSEGKFRISYGTVGNNKVGDFSYLSQFGNLSNNQGYPTNNTYTGGVVPFFYGNDNITWETTHELDLGLNLGLFGDRISIEADYYTKKTTNFLLGVTLPSLAGYSNGANAQYQNAGNLRNQGFEFSLNTVNIESKNFTWTSSFNISFNRSKILSFYNGLDSRQTAWGLAGSASAWISKVGGPLTQFYGYKWGGVYQFADFNQLANGTYVLKNGIPTYSPNVQPGDPKYQDINGDGVVDASDQTTLGNPAPIHTGGFTNNFTYKNFSLNVFFQWSYGNQILNANRIVFESTGGYFLNGNQFATYADRWTPTNPTNDIPRARYNLKGDAGSSNPRPSSRVIEDGSFLRLKTIAFGYTLPTAQARKIKANNVRFNVSAQNILTWTKYSGLDPEVSTYRTANPAGAPPGNNFSTNSNSGSGYSYIQPSSGYSVLAAGYDYTPYPRAFTLTAGVSVTF